MQMSNNDWDNIQAMLVSGGYDPSNGPHPTPKCIVKSKRIEENKRTYSCPRGHNFSTANPLIIAVENDPEYNTGPICIYCLVDWHKRNVNAELISNE